MVIPTERRKDPLQPFTPAQERIAECLADGLSVNETARHLDCSYPTVRTHLAIMARVLVPLPGEPATPVALVRGFALRRRAWREAHAGHPRRAERFPLRRGA